MSLNLRKRLTVVLGAGVLLSTVPCARGTNELDDSVSFQQDEIAAQWGELLQEAESESSEAILNCARFLRKHPLAYVDSDLFDRGYALKIFDAYEGLCKSATNDENSVYVMIQKTRSRVENQVERIAQLRESVDKLRSNAGSPIELTYNNHRLREENSELKSKVESLQTELEEQKQAVVAKAAQHSEVLKRLFKVEAERVQQEEAYREEVSALGEAVATNDKHIRTLTNDVNEMLQMEKGDPETGQALLQRLADASELSQDTESFKQSSEQSFHRRKRPNLSENEDQHSNQQDKRRKQENQNEESEVDLLSENENSGSFQDREDNQREINCQEEEEVINQNFNEQNNEEEQKQEFIDQGENEEEQEEQAPSKENDEETPQQIVHHDETQQEVPVDSNLEGGENAESTTNQEEHPQKEAEPTPVEQEEQTPNSNVQQEEHPQEEAPVEQPSEEQSQPQKPVQPSGMNGQSVEAENPQEAVETPLVQQEAQTEFKAAETVEQWSQLEMDHEQATLQLGGDDEEGLKKRLEELKTFDDFQGACRAALEGSDDVVGLVAAMACALEDVLSDQEVEQLAARIQDREAAFAVLAKQIAEARKRENPNFFKEEA